MKIIHVLGRGLEGCGVSRYALEFHNWAKSAGHESYMVALAKNWTLGGQMKKTIPDLLNVGALEFEEYMPDILKADLIITHSFPPKNSPAEVLAAWDKFLEAPRDGLAVHTCHDHNPMSWARNHDFFPGILKHDGLMVHAVNGKLPVRVYELQKDFPVLPLVLGMKFGDQSDWLPVKQQQRRISYVGRYAHFKDPSRMLPLHAALGPGNDIEVTMFGIARVIESAWLFHHPQCRHMEVSLGKRDFARHTDKVSLYRQYPREVGLKYLRETAVMADFYTLPVYGLSMEYAMFEAVDCGSVLLTERAYAQQAPVFLHKGVVADYISPLTLKALAREKQDMQVRDKILPTKVTTKIDAVGTARILDVMNSNRQREELRQEAFSFCKSLHDSSVAFPWTLKQLI
jgi:hypothetical protein